jgi:hypothetical protein
MAGAIDKARKPAVDAVGSRRPNVGKRPIPSAGRRRSVLSVSASVERLTYLVECYWPGVSEHDVRLLADHTRTAVHALRRQGRELQFGSSILIPAEETVFCLFKGREEDVRAASTEAGVPYERILESLQIEGTQPRRSTQP